MVASGPKNLYINILQDHKSSLLLSLSRSLRVSYVTLLIVLATNCIPMSKAELRA